MTDESVSIRRLAIIGDYSDHDLYQRNRVLVALISEHCDEAVFVGKRQQKTAHSLSVWGSWTERVVSFLSTGLALLQRRREIRAADYLFVPYPAYFALLWLRFLRQLRGRRVIADAFLELRTTVIEDRSIFASGSLWEFLLIKFQKYSLNAADLLLIDTEPQRDSLTRELGPYAPQVTAIPVGIDETLWTPLEPQPLKERLNVLFWGTLIPLHGVQVIVDAAIYLNEQAAPVDFRIVGDGQEAERLAELLDGSSLSSLLWERELLNTQELRKRISEAHICLGTFGASKKAASVVPYKVHQALASNRPVISADVHAIAELVDEDAGFVGIPASGEQLGLAILEMGERLRSGWLPHTRSVYNAHLSNDCIRRKISEALTQ